MYKVSIVISAYNEENRIEKSINNISKFINSSNNIFELIIVDDGSIDNTYSLISKYTWINTIKLDKNYGKGYGLRAGVLKAKYDLIYLADADLSTPISEINKFLDNCNKYSCIIGKRINNSNLVKRSRIRILLSTISNLIINIFLNLNIKDTQCGFKLFNANIKNVFLDCKINRWGFDFEFLYKLKKNNIKVLELPVIWIDEKHSKVSFKDYFSTLLDLIKLRLSK